MSDRFQRANARVQSVQLSRRANSIKLSAVTAPATPEFAVGDGLIDAGQSAGV